MSYQRFNSANMQGKTIVGLLALLVLAVGAWWYATAPDAEAPDAENGNGLEQEIAPVEITATFTCAQGAMVASFSDGIVSVKLPDNREFTLEQTISASGARYANEGEQIVFWNKGNTAMVSENGTTIYENCVTEE